MLVRPLTRALFRPLFRALDGITRAVFVTLEPAASASYTLDSPPEFAGDFKISANVVGSNLTSDQAIIDSAIFGGGTAGEILLFIDNPNGLDLLISRGGGGLFDRITFGGQAAILNGDFNKVLLQRVSGVITAKLNGTQLGGSLTNTETIKFSQGFIGGGAGRFFNGKLANLSLENTATPTNPIKFGFNNLISNTEVSNGVTATYNNISTDADVRGEFELSQAKTQWIGALETIDIAAQA